MREKQLLNSKEAAKYIGISIDVFRSEVNEGRIGFLKVGKVKRFTKEGLNLWMTKLNYQPRIDFTKEVNTSIAISRLKSKGDALSFEKAQELILSQKQKNIV